MQGAVTKKYKIMLAAGIHVRTALTIAKLVGRFKSNVFIKKGENEAGTDSSLGILALGIEEGDEIEIRIEGPDSAALADCFDKLVNDNFGE
ncbi:MAG: HPr family phosphocarrier protein [bacterium]